MDLYYPDGKRPERKPVARSGGLSLYAFTAADLATKREKPIPGDRWGGWYLTEVRSLMLDEGQPGRRLYEVDLDRITSSTDALDWLCQVAHKSWATHQTVGDLLRALECCIGSLQGLCHRDRMRSRGAA
jgi:hypothetical protein